MILYPLPWPTGHHNTQKIRLTALNTVGISASPFTGQQQIYQWPGELWTLEASMPPMKRADAEIWLAWLISLRGRSGTFLAGDPAASSILGSGTLGGEPYPSTNLNTVAGSTTLAVRGFAVSSNNLLLAGDYIQVAQNRILDQAQFANWGKDQSGSTIPVITDGQTGVFGDSFAAAIDYPGLAGGAWSEVFHVLPFVIGNTGPIPVGQWSGAQFSCYMKAGANCTISLLVEDDPYSGSTFASQSCSVTTSWQRFSASLVGGSALTATGLSVKIRCTGPSGAVRVYVDYPAFTAPNFDARLYKVLRPVNSDSGGGANVEIFPRLREPLLPMSRVVLAGAKGTFRLAENQAQWDYDEAKVYGISFKAVESI